MTDYTTLAKVKSELGITGSAEDARFNALITEASALIDSYCGRTFESKTLTEKVKGYGRGSFLQLTHTPIISVASVTLDGEVISADDYDIDDAAAGLLAGHWYDTAPLRYAMGRAHKAGRQRKLYSVTYTGGYVVSGGSKNLPADIERACVEMVRGLYQMTSRDSTVTAEQVDGVGSFTYGNMQVADNKKVAHLLDKYRNIRAMI